ncbi:LysM peptidoglycan-binding domain-containing protein [candidate division KSB1 bacterium]|nr:LysM peptidoglycan-binding domain-containing protein [candidate division KSB1 bacterium]
MALEKAFIQPLNEKGWPKGVPIPVMFNPEQYTIEKSVNYQRTNLPGLQTPATQFVYGNAQTLKLDLFFDTYESGLDVRVHTRLLTGLLDIDREIHAPPVVTFVWGKLKFKAVIDSISQNFTMFLDSGIPVRAKLGVSFTEYRTISEQLTGTPKNSPDRTKFYVLTEADKLWSLADKFYGDARLWRAIAEANNVDNPRLMDSGTELVIPPL